MRKKGLNILYLSTAPPRKCGLATFAKDLSRNIHKCNTNGSYAYFAVHESEDVQTNYEDNVWGKIHKHSLTDYLNAAEFINHSGADMLSIQHEFGIYGGFDGVLLLKLMEKVRIPMAVNLHTVPIFKNAKRQASRIQLLRDITDLSSVVITTSHMAKDVLINDFHFSEEKIEVIWHGAPKIQKLPPEKRKRQKASLGISTKFVLVTFGLLSPNKGLEYAIQAMEGVVKKQQDVSYVIIGEPHPNGKYKKRGFTNYLEYLKKEVQKHGLENHIVFIDQYLKDKELKKYLQIADCMITPYLVPEQVSSGVLSRGMTAGLCILTTPFLYAKEIITEERGVFVDYRSPISIEQHVLRLLKHPETLASLQSNAYTFGEQLHWKHVAKTHLSLFRNIVQ